MTSCLQFYGLSVADKCVQFRYPCLNRSGEIRPKAVGCSIFGHFPNFDKCRPEIADDVISGMTLGYVGVDVRAKFGDSRLNSLASWTRFTYFCAVQYLIAFCSQPETDGDVLARFGGPIVPDKHVKFGDPRLNLSQEIPPEAVGGGIFYVCFRDNFPPGVVK